MNGTFKIAMLISLTLHAAVLAIPGINFSSLFPPTRETKLMQVRLMKTEDLEKEISPGEASPVNMLKEESFLEEIRLAQNKIEGTGKTIEEPVKLIEVEGGAEETADMVERLPPKFPRGVTFPKRIVDFQGYSLSAMEAVFKRYGMRYERCTDELNQAGASNLVDAFTFDKEQLTGKEGRSPVTFSGRPKPGSMVLVIPPKIYLTILEAEREELGKRGLPPDTPLKKVVFGIGQDSQGRYGITVRELVLANSL